jgi:hypothetical protein
MTVERRDPAEDHVYVRGKESRLEEIPNTEDWEREATETEQIVLPEKLSLLRQKLSQKAKQEPTFRFMRYMTGYIGRMCWRLPGNGCAPTGEALGWTA